MHSTISDLATALYNGGVYDLSENSRTRGIKTPALSSKRKSIKLDVLTPVTESPGMLFIPKEVISTIGQKFPRNFREKCKGMDKFSCVIQATFRLNFPGKFLRLVVSCAGGEKIYRRKFLDLQRQKQSYKRKNLTLYFCASCFSFSASITPT